MNLSLPTWHWLRTYDRRWLHGNLLATVTALFLASKQSPKPRGLHADVP